MKIRRGAWNEELFRVLEGFPELAHDDEVDACSGALEMLNPGMKSRGHYEWMRQQAEGLKEQHKPEPSKTTWAPGSVEWQAEQEAKSKARSLLSSENGVTYASIPSRKATIAASQRLPGRVKDGLSIRCFKSIEIIW